MKKILTSQKLRNGFYATSATSLMAFPMLVSAVTTVPNFDNDVKTDVGSPSNLAVRIVNFLLLVAGAVAIIFLIIGGIRYMVSSGNSDQIEKAKHTILYAIIGILIVIFSYAIVNALLKL